MTTRADLASAIAYEMQRSATYKPGIDLHFSAVEDKVVFHLDARVQDSLSRTPNTAIGYTHVIVIPHLAEPFTAERVQIAVKYVGHEVRKALHKFELHEADEWFQIGGVQVHPPHQHHPEES